jgi:VIT1/CCC1 family predicted Fe2+/Mn2+ transporter
MNESATAPEQTEQQNSPAATAQIPPAVASTGQRQAFDNITLPLTDKDLKNPAVVKLIIHIMKTAEAQREELKPYVGFYHEQKEQVGTLKEKLRVNLANEIMFGLLLTLGGAVVGMIPYFWDKDPHDHSAGVICAVVAAVLVLGAIGARIAGRRS